MQVHKPFRYRDEVSLLAPASGTALTDLNGVATFTIGSDGTLGAGTVTAALGGISSSLNYQIGEANLRIGRFQGATFIEGEIQAGATTLPAAGSTPLSVSVESISDAPRKSCTTTPPSSSTSARSTLPLKGTSTGSKGSAPRSLSPERSVATSMRSRLMKVSVSFAMN